MENIYDYTQGIKNWEFTGEYPVVIDFYATWCGPCKMLSPVIETLASEYGEKVRFFKVNVDSNQQFASNCNIQSVPTLFFVRKDGSLLRMVGAQPINALKDIINDYLLKD